MKENIQTAQKFGVKMASQEVFRLYKQEGENWDEDSDEDLEDEEDDDDN